MDRPQETPLAEKIKNILENRDLDNDHLDDDADDTEALDDDWDDLDYEPDFAIDDHDVIDIDDTEDIVGTFFTPDDPLQVSPEIRAARQARRDYIDQYENGSTDQQAAVLLAHLGLTDVSPQELGDNHPMRVAIQQIGKTLDTSKNRGLKPENTQGPESKVRDNRAQYLKTLGLPTRLSPRFNAQANEKILNEAKATVEYMRANKLTVKQVAKTLGHNDSYVYTLRQLADLPNEIQTYLRAGRLSVGHCRAIANMQDPVAAARLIMRGRLSVRQAETMARRLRSVTPDGRLDGETAIPKAWEAEDFMADALGLKVEFKDRAGRGKIVIHYNSPQQAQKVVDQLTCTYFGGH